MTEPPVSQAAAQEQTRASDAEWHNALRAFGSDAERIRRLANAAEYRSSALRLTKLSGRSWPARPGGRGVKLAYGLQPSVNRPGPPQLWRKFDELVAQMGTAMEGTEINPVINVFSELADVLAEIADALERGEERDSDVETPARQTG
jgi:hypothetical protein